VGQNSSGLISFETRDIRNNMQLKFSVKILYVSYMQNASY